MSKLKFVIRVAVTSLFFVVIGNFTAFAHYPPSCGQTDCGLIQGSTFYSSYYSPGNPNGTPVSAGGGTWTKTSTTSCGTYTYQGYKYTLYPHKFICAIPLDMNSYWMMAGLGLMGFLRLRKQLIN
ncbi:MAG: hypothetical protein V4663_00415 [Bacteroidota bacterium]